MNWLNKHNVLVLNSLYQAIGTLTPKKALVTLNSSFDDITPAAKVINVVYVFKDDGTLDLNLVEYWQAMTFEEWLSVGLRPGIDKAIRTCKLQLRCPTVIVSNYSKMPLKEFRPTKSILYNLQQGRCGYSGKQIPFHKGSIEHKKPKSEGGKDTFENLMYVEAEINHKRGNKPLEELGLKPLFHHKTPKPIPVSYVIKNSGEIKHPDWRVFL